MRRRVILMIAASLDGYIADRGGGVSWLPEGEAESGSETSFMGGIDTVVMGWNTYRQVVTELSPGQWPYEGLDAWVFTHRPAPEDAPAGVRFTSRPLAALARELKKQPGRGIWLCGGASLARQALEQGLVDELRLTILPVLLGEGIPLFGPMKRPQRLSLLSHQVYNGMVECVYRRREVLP